MRQDLNAKLYLTVGCIQWRRLPSDYPPCQSVDYCFRKRRDDVSWQRLLDSLRVRVRHRIGTHKNPIAGSIDSQTVKTAIPLGVRACDGGKPTIERKRHLLVATLGLILADLGTTADMSDCDGERLLFRRSCGFGQNLRLIGVDGSCRGFLHTCVSQSSCCCLRPVLHPQEQPGFSLLPIRWVVKSTFA